MPLGEFQLRFDDRTGLYFYFHISGDFASRDLLHAAIVTRVLRSPVESYLLAFQAFCS